MSHITTTLDGAVLRIEMNRPDKKNALTAAMYQKLADAIEGASTDPTVRVLLVTGTPDTFTAGNDLQDFLQSPPVGPESPVHRFLLAISHTPKPVVAAVNGIAVGVGTTMLLHCDLVYAAADARFHLPFVDLGLCPEAGSSYLLPAVAGYQRAAQLLLLGEPFDAAAAREIGVVTAVLDPSEVLEAATAAARKLAAKPPAALRIAKALMKRAITPAVETAMAAEGGHFVELLRSPEAKEAFTAFLEKRKPDFSQFS